MQQAPLTMIEGLIVIEPKVFGDSRGTFFEAYHEQRYMALGINQPFVQDNEAESRKGVLRGLHYQVGEMAQSKLVRVVRGSVFDIAVDLREGSETYGAWFGIELSAQNKTQFYIPHGFAHGYLALEDNTILSYKCDNYYSRDHEGGLRFDDPQVGVQWPRLDTDYILSEKDIALPYFGQHRK